MNNRSHESSWKQCFHLIVGTFFDCLSFDDSIDSIHCGVRINGNISNLLDVLILDNRNF